MQISEDPFSFSLAEICCSFVLVQFTLIRNVHYNYNYSTVGPMQSFGSLKKGFYTSTPARLVQSNNNSTSLGGMHSAMLKLVSEDISLTYPTTVYSQYVYSFKYNWVNWGIVERTKMANLWNGIERDLNSAPSIESPGTVGSYQLSHTVIIFRLHLNIYF